MARGSFCPQEAAEPWPRVLEQTKAVTLPHPIWAAAARSVSYRAGQRQAETEEEVGGHFFTPRAPTDIQGSPSTFRLVPTALCGVYLPGDWQQW